MGRQGGDRLHTFHALTNFKHPENTIHTCTSPLKKAIEIYNTIKTFFGGMYSKDGRSNKIMEGK